ncbi:MAG: ABC transporter ATP-binding protein [Dehalococcoidia bacterium]
MATLEVRSLSRFAPRDGVVVDDVSFSVRAGRVAALLAPSGAGKTALLRLIAGLDQPDAGDVLLDDASVVRQRPHRRGIGMMFRDLGLFPHRDVRGNVAFGLRMLGWPRLDRDQRVEELLELVGLPGRGGARVASLSIDEQERVALARTLAPQPSVLLLDEPLNGNGRMTETLRGELRDLLHRLEAATVVATSDLRLASSVADDLIVMRDGRVLQAGPLHVVLTEPVSAEVAAILGYVTLVHGNVDGDHVSEDDAGAVSLPEAPPTGSTAIIMAHPSSLLAVPDPALGCGVRGTVTRSRPIGPTWAVDLAVGPRIVEARWEWDLAPPLPGAELGVAVPPGRLRVFATAAEAPPTDDDEPPAFVRPTRRSSTQQQPADAPPPGDDGGGPEDGPDGDATTADAGDGTPTLDPSLDPSLDPRPGRRAPGEPAPSGRPHRGMPLD